MTGTRNTLNWLAALALIFAFTLATGESHSAPEPASVRSTSGYAADRAPDGRHDFSGVSPARPEAKPQNEKASDGAVARAADCCSHYVYDGFTELFDDIDRDGYYSYLRISVDVDTDYYESDVYLKAYLRGSFGGWQEIYTSHIFTISGNSSFDDYEIESELISGFESDHYDVMVEVYEAATGELLLDYGPAENSAFSLLPLEDVNRDGAITPPIAVSYGSSGGGSLSWGLLSALAAAGLLRRTRRARSGRCQDPIACFLNRGGSAGGRADAGTLP